ncbi:hypothetical protein Pmani_026450 [Petrolisthes manimaculis]|uniref:GATA zinc finger domain-containing protein 1 n=1 Tax=Petrolisthes manimaculis TaxID=1843537 RepID=A0AAE1TXV1_9EUCA|nr:hypothetical protein Pmani_026450 [Petrolisthes manimaculis]
MRTLTTTTTTTTTSTTTNQTKPSFKKNTHINRQQSNKTMVFGLKPVCVRCKATESNLWQKNDNDQILCVECQTKSNGGNNNNGNGNGNGNNSNNSNNNNNGKMMASSARQQKERDDDDQDTRRDEEKMEATEEHKDNGDSSNGKDDDQDGGGGGGDKDRDSGGGGGRGSEKRGDTKRKTRKGRQGGKGSIPKGKGRRYIFKKSATKAPVAVATPVTSEYLFYKGLYYQVGDIVSVVDVDGGTYYAQIRGLLQDQYCEKSAVLTWLLPTKSSPTPQNGFDPATYIIGPEEDIPRKLEYMEFECHAPSDYFKDQTSPYSTMTYQPQSCFVWSRLGPQIKPLEKAKELMAK